MSRFPRARALTVLALLGAVARADSEPASAPCHETATEIYQAVSPAVVLVNAVSRNPHVSGERAERSSGSGVLIDPSGLIVTNSHVVFGQQVLTVTLDDGTTIPARIVGADPVFDIAVIRIPKPTEGTLPVAQLGESSGLLVGQEVYAIGNPFGLEQTLTRGIVSAVNRVMPGASWSLKEPMIQTDAAINHGSSGGPIVDACGKVVGIAAAILPEAQNISFAIPIDLVSKVVPDLVANGRVIRPWLGVQGQLVSPQLKNLLKVPLTDGFLVEAVEPGSPAETQGVRGGGFDLVISGVPLLLGGDIITAIDDKPLGDPEKIGAVLETLKVGRTVELTLFHDDTVRKVRASIVERPMLPQDFSSRMAAVPAGDAPGAAQDRLVHPVREAF